MCWYPLQSAGALGNCCPSQVYGWAAKLGLFVPFLNAAMIVAVVRLSAIGDSTDWIFMIVWTPISVMVVMATFGVYLLRICMYSVESGLLFGGSMGPPHVIFSAPAPAAAITRGSVHGSMT